MYYYIFEPPLEAKEYERTAQIKEYLATIGIAGEMTAPTPGRSVEDLIQLAIGKRYSTIIAVGGVELINQVARGLEPHDVVFGIIPFQENPDIELLTGVSAWKEAADALKRRRWQPVRLGLLNQGMCFLTPATVSLPDGAGFTLVSPDFTVKGQGGELSITPLAGEPGQAGRLLIEITHPQPKRKGLLSGLLKQASSLPMDSRFEVEKAELTTEGSHRVMVAGAEFCTTPATYDTQEKPLRLIVSRSTAQV
ncbi:MAG: hypothetical protein WCO52_01935 [bacterium]